MTTPLSCTLGLEDDTSIAMDFDAELQALEAFLDDYNGEELGNGIMAKLGGESYTDVFETATEVEAIDEPPGSDDFLENTTEPPRCSTAAMLATSPSTARQPKPIRRDYRKEEMTRLRWMDQYLTKKLKLLEATSSQSTASQKKVEKEEHSDKPTSPLKESLWHQIALKQLQRRRKAEEENTSLRNMVYTQVLEAKNLRRILKRRARIEVRTQIVGVVYCMMEHMLDIKQRKGLARRTAIPLDNEQVFQSMLRDADEHYRGVESLFAQNGILDVPCPGRRCHAKPNASHGTNFELMQKNLIPFGLHNAEGALWRALCRIDVGNLQIADVNAQVYATVQYREEKVDRMAASFVVSVSGVECLSAVQIRKVVRRYAKADGTVFVCQTLSEPTPEAMGVAFRTSTTAQVVVKQATNLGASENEVSLIQSHVGVTNHVPCDQLSPSASEGDSVIAIWDGVIAGIWNDMESFLLNESLQQAQPQKRDKQYL
ncbi:hypothetical protein BBJ28_00023274 [Nothophytophthora sp. Chile5]|nr:hypothetical protein BBJ28_00023274 [Nothophytophthora sp. Chile5]